MNSISTGKKIYNKKKFVINCGNKQWKTLNMNAETR